MKFENTQVYNFEGAIRGMRNPMNSWDRSDSTFGGGVAALGDNDLKLAQRLIRAGSEHRKFLRQIFVCVDITAPLYWWNEFDTYKIGTVANSTSKMHKLASTPITLDCFETDDYAADLEIDPGGEFGSINSIAERLQIDLIEILETLRQRYNSTGGKRYWKELIRWLPESWLQTRTVTMNYENVFTMCRQRKGHKLCEWLRFIEWAQTLPYAQELIFGGVVNG